MSLALIPGIDPSTVTPVPYLGGWTTGSESAQVRAPYDDALLGSVPVMTPADVDAAVAYAKAALHAEPLP
jgi:acyl-CoA reductase-like NAD-dependent aldehyde dehydrogenase